MHPILRANLSCGRQKIIKIPSFAIKQRVAPAPQPRSCIASSLQHLVGKQWRWHRKSAVTKYPPSQPWYEKLINKKKEKKTKKNCFAAFKRAVNFYSSPVLQQLEQKFKCNRWVMTTDWRKNGSSRPLVFFLRASLAKKKNPPPTFKVFEPSTCPLLRNRAGTVARVWGKRRQTRVEMRRRMFLPLRQTLMSIPPATSCNLCRWD